MYLFDTNAFELLANGDTATLKRVIEHQQEVWLSSVAVEERMVGYISSINRARSSRTSLSIAKAHSDFVEALEDNKLLPIFAYSEAAEEVYTTFSASIKRIGQQDCRIAAQAIAHGWTVITRNIRDFEAIGAPCEDWSR